jgi:hypothetical protein
MCFFQAPLAKSSVHVRAATQPFGLRFPTARVFAIRRSNLAPMTIPGAVPAPDAGLDAFSAASCDLQPVQ